MMVVGLVDNLSEKQKKRRRLALQRLCQVLAPRIVFFIILPFLIPAIFILFTIYFTSIHISDEVILLVVVTYAIYIATIISLNLIISQINKITERSIHSIEKKCDSIDRTIEEKLSITIESLSGRNHVSEAVSIALDLVLSRKEEYRKTSNFPKIDKYNHSDYGVDQFIYYFGSATINSTFSEDTKHSEGGSSTISPREKYINSLRKVQERKMGFKRLVRLFEVPSFERRSSDVRIAYLKWLDGQIKMINDNPNYVLIDARRAPRFQALRNFIITPEIYVDIMGDGAHGFRGRGRSFAEDQLVSAIDYLYNNPSAKVPVRYSNQEGDLDLSAHLKKLKQCHTNELEREQSSETQGSY